MIKVTDRFYITSNSNCYTLTEKTTIKDPASPNCGKEVFKDLSYYVTLENCLKGILKTVTRQYISSEEVNTIEELRQQIRLTTEFIQSLNLKF